jgi:hypothetical protein
MSILRKCAQDAQNVNVCSTGCGTGWRSWEFTVSSLPRQTPLFFETVIDHYQALWHSGHLTSQGGIPI